MSDLKAQKGRSHVQTSLLLPRHRDSTNVDNCSNDKKWEHSAVRRLLSRPNTTKFEPLLAHFHMTKDDVGFGIELNRENICSDFDFSELNDYVCLIL